MSRIRSIHPGLWTDEAFVTLTPVARLFLIGLWNECDDRGIFQWSPLQLKMRILPLEGTQPEKLLMELVETGFVLSYILAGKQFGAVKNFMKFQHPKKPRFVFPVTDDVCHFVSDGEAVPNQFPTSSEPVPIGEERKEGEGKGREEPNGSCATAEWLMEEWNDLAKLCDLPAVRSLTAERKRKAKLCLKEYPDMEIWETAFKHIHDSPFLRGNGKTGWKANFNWLLQPDTIAKLSEETYGIAN